MPCSSTNLENLQAGRDLNIKITYPGAEQTQEADLERFAAHSRSVLGSISEHLPNGAQIQRPALRTSILEHLENSQVVLIAGVAGYGKSVLAKMVSLGRSEQARVLAFKAEDLDKSSLASALADLGATQGVRGIETALESSPPSLVLIDGLEKIAEFESREAVAQLLGLLRSHKGARAMLTVRSHAVEMVYSNLLADLGVTIVDVPLLDDQELELALHAGPLDYAKIRGSNLTPVLRVPFYLRLALTHSACVSAAPSQSPNDLKQFLWLQAVTNPASAAENMPDRRKRTFDETCLRRAQRVVQFVEQPSDSEAVSALLNDGILVADEHSRVAPAHDIFDDWSLHNYIQRKVVAAEYDWPTFFETVGTHPGIRRAYRSWLTEAITSKESEALDLVRRIFDEPSIPPFWRDDSLVGMLRSEHAPAFIDEHEALLVQDGMARLRRLVHLLRVACKGPREDLPPLPTDGGFPTEIKIRYALTMPVGSAWGKVIQLVSSHLNKLNDTDHPWIAGLIEDWLSGERDFYHPNETTHATLTIGLHVLCSFGTAWAARSELAKRFLSIVLKTLGADPEQVRTFLQMCKDDHRRTWDAKNIIEYALEFTNCGPLCFYLPDFVIAALWSLYVRSDHDGREWSHEIEPKFGLCAGQHLQFFAPSAYQGPFWQLLRIHPVKAVKNTVKLCNHAAEMSRHSKFQDEIIALTVPFLPEGNQFLLSERMWLAHRGTTVAPYMLESALMALEKWFLEAHTVGVNIVPFLEYVLHKGTSAFTLSIVASVLNAYPNLCSEKFLDLFRVREFIGMDRIRVVYESHTHAMASPRNPMSAAMQQERTESNKLPHRRFDLEWLIFRLQIEAPQLKEAIWQILDDHKAAIDSGDTFKETQLWRLALKRMDLREMKPGEPSQEGYIPLEIRELGSDLQQLVEDGAEQWRGTNIATRLFLWGNSFFDADAEQHRTLYPSHVEALAEFHRFEQEPAKEDSYVTPNLPALIAATLIRLDSDEIGGETRAWAEGEICKAVATPVEYNDLETMQRFNADGSRAAACVLPLALSKTKQRELLLGALAEALTHPTDEIREYAIRGVQQFLWKSEPTLARVCVLGLAHLAMMMGTALNILLYPEREVAWKQSFGKARAKLLDGLKASVLDEPQLDQQLCYFPYLTPALETVPLNLDWEWSNSAMGMLVDAAATATKNKADKHDLSYEAQYAIAKLYASQLLYATLARLRAESPRLKNLCEQIPDFAAMVLEDVLVEQYGAGDGTTNFWTLWDIATGICYRQPSIFQDRRWYHSSYEKLLRILLFQSALFQSVPWIPDAHDFAILRRRPNFIRDSIRAIGTSALGFECVVNLLEGVGRGIGIPGALIELQQALDGHTQQNPLEIEVILWKIETVMRVAIHEHSAAIKKNNPLRAAVLTLLNKMVDAGSSVAFQLRDYFITAPVKSMSNI